MSINLRELSGQEFEDRCNKTLSKIYPLDEHTSGGGRGGMRQYGIDFRYKDIVFQHKHFTCFQRAQKQQITNSLKKLREAINSEVPRNVLPEGLSKWILCIPIELNPDEFTWIKDKVIEILGPDVKVDVWGETKLSILITSTALLSDYLTYLEGVIKANYLDIWDTLSEDYAPWDKQYVSLPLKSTTEILDIDDAVRKYSSLLIVGDLGSGKTTILQHINMEYAANAKKQLECRHQLGNQDVIIPIYIGLRDYTFDQHKADFENILLLCKNALKSRGVSSESIEGPGILENEFERRRFLFLFDSLNEVPQNWMPNCIESIRAFQQRFVKQAHLYVVTTRKIYVGEPYHRLKGFHEVTIESLSKDDIKQYIRLYLKDEELTEELSRKIINDSRLRELAQNPLSLGIVTHIYRSNPSIRENFPRCIGKLIGKFIEGVLERENLEKRNKFDGSVKHEVLTSISEKMYGIGEAGAKLERYKLKEEEVLDAVKQKLQKLGKNDINVTQLVSELKSNQLLVIEDKEIKFWHSRFQEYFFSCSIREEWLSKDHKKIENYVKNREWYYLFSMMAGILSGHPYKPLSNIQAQAEELFDFVYRRNKLLAAMCVGQTDDLPKGVEEKFVNELKDKILNEERNHRRNILWSFRLLASVWVSGLLVLGKMTVSLSPEYAIIGFFILILYLGLLPWIFISKVLRCAINKNITSVEQEITPLLLILNQAGLGSPYTREALMEIRHKFETKRPTYLRETADETGKISDKVLGMVSYYTKPINRTEVEFLKELLHQKTQMYALEELLVLFTAGKLSGNALDEIVAMLDINEDFVVGGALNFFQRAYTKGRSESLELKERHDRIAEALRRLLLDPRRKSKTKKLAHDILKRMGEHPSSRYVLFQAFRRLFAFIKRSIIFIFHIGSKKGRYE